jgi:hypothetical protein
VVPAFLMDIKVMKTKAQERYGNTSGMKIFLINWKKGHLRILKYLNNPELNFRKPEFFPYE